MANTPKTRQATRDALAVHVNATGGQENDFATKIVDLIADLLLLLPDDETAGLVTAAAVEHAEQDRAGI